MKTAFRWTNLAVATAVLLWVGTVHAQSFAKLSVNHTKYGVSQLVAGNGTAFQNAAIKLINPGHHPMVYAALIYDRHNDSRATGTQGKFLECIVRSLDSHVATVIPSSSQEPFITLDATSGRFYTEIISAPTAPVTAGGKSTRIADGLGIIASGGFMEDNLWNPVNPALFNLPSDFVVQGQKAKAQHCICNGLQSGGFPSDTFAEFGVPCS